MALCTASDVEFSIIKTFSGTFGEIQNDSQFARVCTIDGTYIYIVGITDADGQNYGYLNQDPRRYRKNARRWPTAAEVLEMIEPYVKPGVSTGDWIASVMITLLMNNTRFLPAWLSRLSEIRLHLY